jgi:hypothetical protein
MMQWLLLADAALALPNAAAELALAAAAAVPLCCGRWGAGQQAAHVACGWGCAVMPTSKTASFYTVSTAQQQQQQQQQLGLLGSCRQLALAGRAS